MTEEIKTIEVSENIYLIFEQISKKLDIPLNKLIETALKEFLLDLITDLKDCSKIYPLLKKLFGTIISLDLNEEIL